MNEPTALEMRATELSEQYLHIQVTHDAPVTVEGPFAYCEEFLGPVWQGHRDRFRVPLKMDTHCALIVANLAKMSGRNIYYGDADSVEQALISLGLAASIPAEFRGRKIEVHLSKQREVFLRVSRHKYDMRPPGMWAMPSDRFWELLVGRVAHQPEKDIVPEDIEQFVRVVEEGGTNHHYIKTSEDSGGHWTRSNTGTVLRVLQHKFDIRRSVAEPLLGALEVVPWEAADLPFQPEYPGGRVWNRTKIGWAVELQECHDLCRECPTWDKILSHCGKDLDNDAPRHGFADGADYLLAWFAAMVQEPEQPTPYLFLFGPENSGKSILHESFELLVTGGVTKADRALTSQTFNGELDSSLLCVVEETDLSRSYGALNKIKDYVTSRKVSIRKMRTDSYMAVNMTHWIQTANSQDYCPIIEGDTRITAIEILPPEEDIPKPLLLKSLADEAGKFAYLLANYKLPPVTGRLRIPVIKTATSARIVDRNRPEWILGIVDLMRDREFWTGTATEFSTLLSSEKNAFDAPVTARKLRNGLCVHKSFLDRNFIDFEIEGDGNRTRTLVLRKSI